MKEQRADRVLYVCGLSYRTFRNFITGQCTEAVILGTMFIISMSILRMPYAVLVGVVIMVTALIPIVGGFIGCEVGGKEHGEKVIKSLKEHGIKVELE